MDYQDHMRHRTNEGMGGYLDPPEFPTHTYSVGSGSQSNPHSIVSIIDCAYVDPAIRQQAKDLIAAWHANRPALNSPAVQAWIVDCQRHWKDYWFSVEPDRYGCHAGSTYWRGPARTPDAPDYAIYHIQKFYPEYQPTGDPL